MSKFCHDCTAFLFPPLSLFLLSFKLCLFWNFPRHVLCHVPFPRPQWVDLLWRSPDLVICLLSCSSFVRSQSKYWDQFSAKLLKHSSHYCHLHLISRLPASVRLKPFTACLTPVWVTIKASETPFSTKTDHNLKNTKELNLIPSDKLLAW